MSNIFRTPAQIISGEGALESAGPAFAQMGKKALIVSDAMMQKLGNIDRLVAVLDKQGLAYDVYAEVNSEPTDKIVAAGVDQYKASGCDFLIAIGGGSPIDTMKAIAMIATLGGAPVDYMGKEVNASLPGMAAIPTTAGTGSEATQFTIISDTGTDVKMLLKGASLLPTMAVVDPVFTMTAPPAVTAATGVDALCHAIEAYTSKKAQPLSDTFALSASARIFASLRTAYAQPDNVPARTQMALAATEAGIAFNNASVTIIHGMSRPIGALFHVAHGLSNAMLMEKCLCFAKDGQEARFAQVARHCGMATASTSDVDAAGILMDEIAKLLKDLKIPSLAEHGIDKDAFYAAIPKMASDAQTSGSPGNTLRDVSVEDMQKLYNEIYGA